MYHLHLHAFSLQHCIHYYHMDIQLQNKHTINPMDNTAVTMVILQVDYIDYIKCTCTYKHALYKLDPLTCHESHSSQCLLHSDLGHRGQVEVCVV